MQEYLEKTKQELKLKNYSFKTIKAHLGCLREYLGEGLGQFLNFNTIAFQT
jgi:hypothetical protein